MEIIPRENIKSLKFPLPIFEAVDIADAVNKDGEIFHIFVGLNRELVSQLTKLSSDMSDAELHKNTPDSKRFAEGSYENWYKKVRTPFALVHKNTNTLAAIVWLGPRKLNDKEGNWHTAAWRSYNPWRGRGLMKSFGNFAIDVYLKHFPDVKLWITAKKENTGSLSLAEALGFRKIKSIREEGFFEMIKES
jgi:hypothetical protein